MTIGKLDTSLYYGLGIDVPALLIPHVQEVLSSLARTVTSEQFLAITSQGAAAEKTREALQLLEKNGVAECISHTGGASNWTMTRGGARRLRLANAVVSEALVFKARDGVPLSEQALFELLWRLQQDGWLCRLFHARRKGTIPNPYVVGAKKKWHLRPTANQFQRWYILALLVEEHGRSVEHCKSDAYYKTLLGDLLQKYELQSKRANVNHEFDIGSVEKEVTSRQIIQSEFAPLPKSPSNREMRTPFVRMGI